MTTAYERVAQRDFELFIQLQSFRCAMFLMRFADE